MKDNGSKRRMFYLLLTAAFLLIVVSIVLMAHTLNHSNTLSLQRQDSQLESMVQAADAGMAGYLRSFREELRYVIGRRGFTNAESEWRRSGDASDLQTRMQDNLVMGNPLIHDMLAVRDETIILSAADNLPYYFPDGLQGDLLPCFAGDGTMYLALFEDGQHARYAVLLSMSDWYSQLADTYGNDIIHLMLLGSQKRILLHSWMGQLQVSVMDELNNSNCDLQAVRHMVESHTSGQQLTATYSLTYPGDDFVHEMRMTALPPPECSNGYFIVGLTSDYDDVLRPMQAAAWGMSVSGALLVSGVLLMILTAILLVHQNRSRDRELERLIQRNEETQRLLEKTTALAHHQRLETIGTLTASIAHEFNNLLTPIMGYAILTLEGLPEERGDLADNIAEIYEASRKAKDIISRLSALSRRNEEIHFRSLSLRTIAEKALQVAAPALPARVTPHLTADSDDCFISGNETQLSQLFLNLILNACHAMEKSGGTLSITICTQGDHAVVQVQDEGDGIPADVLPRIFDPFFTTKESGRGTGLGLAIVQQVMENHHGIILVTSTPGQGSTFTLRFPLTKSSQSAIS